METRGRVSLRWGIIGGVVLLVMAALSAYVIQNNRLTAGQSVHSLTVDQRERSYHLYVPESLPAGKVPLVVMLHGALGSGRQAEEVYGWNEQADEHGFIVAYPDGLDRFWAVSEDCCGPSARDKVDDVAFIRSMVGEIQKKAPIDARRIYVAGMSDGGALTYRLACDTDIFAAIGVVSATLLGECSNPRKLSVMHIHGTADEVFPYAGGPGKHHNGGQGDQPADTAGLSMPELMNVWRRANDCAPLAVTIDGAVRRGSAACEDGREVVFIVIDGAGHQWPGSSDSKDAGKLLGLDPPSAELKATETLWSFFAKHRAAEPPDNQRSKS